MRVRCKEFHQNGFQFLVLMLRNFSFNISGCSKVKVFNDLRGGAAPHPGALGLSSTVPSKVGNGAISDMTPQFIYFG